ncbi:hypothetical protein BJF82_05170 [Kytococcus sp. CUA-901]|nr:hypothetical protein BJF82_05170 [Kytococcus sp. CUA-901]
MGRGPAEAIRTCLAGHRDAIAQGRAPQLLAGITPHLKRKAASTVTTLGKAAAALPDGPLALDAEAVIAADAATERTTATACLADLGVLTSVRVTPTPPPGVPPVIAAMLRVLDVPAVKVENITRLDRKTTNPDPKRQSVRDLADYAEAHGLDLAQVAVARSEFDGLVLSWAETAGEAAERAERARVAFTERVVDEDRGATGNRLVTL